MVHATNNTYLFYGASDSEGCPGSADYDYAFAVTGADPLLVDSSAYDSWLQVSSPAMAVESGDSALVTVVASDYVGVSRPRRASYNVGAYEHPD